MPGETFVMKPIGFVRSPYKETSDVPKGLGTQHTAEGVLEIAAELEEGLTDIEGFSHLIVVWVFDRSHGFELLGTPPSDNRPHGVFATRSPYRPNPIGLTAVELLRREGRKLYVRGIDMLDGTPILDIKPYLSGIPHESLKRGWLEEAERRVKALVLCGLLLGAATSSYAADERSKPAVQQNVSILLKNRSIEGLEAVRTKHGAVKVHLHGRFQHAMVLRVRPDGSLTIECVDSAERAAELAGVPAPKE